MGNFIKTNLHKCVLATLFLCFGLVSCDSYYENLVLEGQMVGKWYNEELNDEKHVYNEYEFYHNGGWIFTSVENDSVVKTDKGYYDLVFGRLYMSSATEPFSTYDVEINDNNVMTISYNGVPSSYKRK